MHKWHSFKQIYHTAFTTNDNGTIDKESNFLFYTNVELNRIVNAMNHPFEYTLENNNNNKTEEQ